MEITMTSIGVIHTPLLRQSEAPIQSSRSNIVGTIELYPQYQEGLEGIEGFSHVYLLFWFHCSTQAVSLMVKPFLDDQIHGIFSTRSPCRPNFLGLSVVQLTGRQANTLSFIGADMLDGSPLLDIKPYIPEFDVFTVEKSGWYQKRKDE